MSNMQIIELNGKLELSLPDGTSVVVQPGPYRKGISMTPVVPDQPKPRRIPTAPGTGKRGRKPRQVTVDLRDLLDKHLSKGAVKDPKYYVDFVLDNDDDISLAVARQIVYRERRVAIDSM